MIDLYPSQYFDKGDRCPLSPSFQNEEGNLVSISSANSVEYPIRKEYYVTYEDYSESVVLYGISM